MNKHQRDINRLIEKLPSLDKTKLCQLIQDETGLPSEKIQAIVNQLLDEMKMEFLSGRSVPIKNFGTFELLQLKPKKIFNINSGKAEVVERGKRLKFSLERQFASFLTKLLK